MRVVCFAIDLTRTSLVVCLEGCNEVSLDRHPGRKSFVTRSVSLTCFFHFFRLVTPS